MKNEMNVLDANYQGKIRMEGGEGRFMYGNRFGQ